ncbi:MAG: hypothetical protein IT381_33245 [Deltaproteobacteria bacterium]|nr:hypothetical protein [Deltaproteobacteria bacterium]
MRPTRLLAPIVVLLCCCALPSAPVTSGDASGSAPQGAQGVTSATGATGPTMKADADGTKPAVKLSGEAFLAAYIDAICDNIGACCTSGGLDYDAERCRAGMLAQASATPVADVDPGTAEQCIAFVTSAVTACAPPAGPMRNACTEIFTPQGPQKPGEDCTASADCSTGADDGYPYCAVASGASSGTCKEYVPGKVGDVCASTSATTIYLCPESAFCSTSAATSTCKPRQSIGSTCTSDSCVADAYCSAAASPVCTKRIAIGQSCAAAPQGCAAGAFCSQESGECEAYKKPGIASPLVCGSSPLVGVWTAFGLPIASINGDVDGEATYEFTATAASFAIATHDSNGPLGVATLAGTYTFTQTVSGIVASFVYTSAVVKDGAGAAVPVTSGKCSKHNNCDAFVFGAGNPTPEPCACKQQTHTFSRVSATQMTSDVYEEDLSFYLQH